MASLSRRTRSAGLRPTDRWSLSDRADAERRLLALLKGAGDPKQERLCRLPITYSLSRALTAAEIDALPPHARDAEGRMLCPVSLAGAPLQVLRERGVPFVASAQPCRSPRRDILNPARPDLWIARDCGECPSCVARRALEETTR